MKQLLLSTSFLILSQLAFTQEKETLTVNFDFNKYDLTTESVAKLDSFIYSISKSTVISMELDGHCDSKGSDAYNDALSLRRVNVVKEFLEKDKTIHTSITAKGFGETKLLNSDITEEDGHQNRRVEVVAIIKTQPKEQPVAEVIKETKTLTAILEDTATKVGALVTLPNLNFENNSDVLIPSSIPTLKELLNVLQQNPKMKIVIEGHICCVTQIEGVPFNERPNFQISLLRAKMVFGYLSNNGIDQGRMSYKAFGSSRPVYPIPEKSEAEMIANRRVEIRIVDK